MIINPKWKRHLYEKVCDTPAAWLDVAEVLRLAADHIDFRPIDFNNPSRAAVELIPVQKMLVGLSFENLLKGLLIAFGRPAREKGKLAGHLRKHRIQVHPEEASKAWPKSGHAGLI